MASLAMRWGIWMSIYICLPRLQGGPSQAGWVQTQTLLPGNYTDKRNHPEKSLLEAVMLMH